MQWSKILPIILIIISFSIIIYFITKSFRSTCSSGFEFNDKLNKCVPKCDSPLVINEDGTKCICKDNKIFNKETQKCVKNCKIDNPDSPLLCGTDSCYSSENSQCINGEVCPNSLSCNNKCCKIGTYCSNGRIIFENTDTFKLFEKNYDIDISIQKNLIGYSLDPKDTSNYLPVILENLLNENTKNNYKYTISLEKNNLIFNITNNNTFQPTFDFTNMKNPEKIGFSNKIFEFKDNQLKSNSIDIFTCEKRSCNDNEIICDNNCCQKEYCIKDYSNNNNVCCNEKDGYKICKSDSNENTTCCSPNRSCCNGNCCSEGEDCINGVCISRCKYPNKNGNILHCDDKQNEHCINIENRKISYCGHKDCTFNTVQYWPPLIDGPGHSEKTKNAIITCVDNTNGKCGLDNQNDDSNCKYYTKNNNKLNLQRFEISPFSESKNKNCTSDDCDNRLNEYGVESVNVYNNKICLANFNCPTILKENENNCVANFNCATILEKNGNDCPFGNNHPQCCYNDSEYTGQICKQNLIAYYNSDTNDCDCILGWEIKELPNKRGTYCEIIKNGDKKPNDPKKFSTVKCGTNCNIGYYGDNCENIVDVNTYTEEKIIDILNNLDYIKVNGYKNFQELFNRFPINTYILVYCINNNSQYYNYCAQQSFNYYDEDDIRYSFHQSIYGPNKGDFIYNKGDLSFWWNVDNCNPPSVVSGDNVRYISLNAFGDIRTATLGNQVKYFPKVFVNGYSTLGVLLIGPSN